MSARPSRGLELLDAGEKLSPRSMRELLTAAVELEAIVRDLAADPRVFVDVDECSFCGAEFPLERALTIPDSPAAGCPLHRLVEWAAARPVSGTEAP